MAADVLISFLPCEVIEYILINDNLTVNDLINFGKTCKLFYKTITSSNKIWRTKLFKRWPNLKENYEKNEIHGYEVRNWLGEYRISLEYRRELMKELSLMSSLHYKKQELSHSKLQNYDRLFRQELGAPPYAYYSIIDELISIIDESPLTSNLTHKYYAYKVIRYIRQCYLANEWNKFINLPENKQTLERGAILVSQWSQPEKRVSDLIVKSQLDNIADTTKKLLHDKNPCHPIYSTPIDVLNEWKDTNIYDNQWNSNDTREIMTVLCDVMFKKMLFHGNSEMYYSSVNSFIDQVLEKRRGIPITLAIVFESVARRLGVRCEAVSFPSHFLLRWKESYTCDNQDECENFYIDVFNGGQFLTKNSCPKISGISRCPIERHNVHKATSAIEVVQRMANNLEIAGRQRTHLNGRAARLRSALDLLYLVRPYDPNTILHLARFYILHQMDLAELVVILRNMEKNLDLASKGQVNHILRMLEDYENHTIVINEEDTVPKIHPEKVKYAVGMIMRHRSYGYLCVITGWDEKCEATPDWMNEMGIDELLNGQNQPFYHLFADDGSIRYAAEENLTVAPNPNLVCHDEIGRFFYKYCITHYLPNAEKQKEYPTDDQIHDDYFHISLDL
ncbi:hypothetical protein HCN44_004580 [Aphidius gifuensis]|uniref:Hemimethylated DNA-binding domain-containing protein n=1 Tax=Aphidius gifuensis TaxID=684658 RepID=A0A834XZI7_APHGI|nr:F-box only protein 21-like [Aphidius gifuensis]KAF7995108.1 hypothetical protein HCN44_004580 [Aphidius gifuensis]